MGEGPVVPAVIARNAALRISALALKFPQRYKISLYAYCDLGGGGDDGAQVPPPPPPPMWNQRQAVEGQGWRRNMYLGDAGGRRGTHQPIWRITLLSSTSSGMDYEPKTAGPSSPHSSKLFATRNGWCCRTGVDNTVGDKMRNAAAEHQATERNMTATVRTSGWAPARLPSLYMCSATHASTETVWTSFCS